MDPPTEPSQPRLLHCENCGAEHPFPTIRLAYFLPPHSEKLLLFLCGECTAQLNTRHLTDEDYIKARGSEFQPILFLPGG